MNAATVRSRSCEESICSEAGGASVDASDAGSWADASEPFWASAITTAAASTVTTGINQIARPDLAASLFGPRRRREEFFISGSVLALPAHGRGAGGRSLTEGKQTFDAVRGAAHNSPLASHYLDHTT